MIHRRGGANKQQGIKQHLSRDSDMDVALARGGQGHKKKMAFLLL